jgi:Peptidase family M1 domain
MTTIRKVLLTGLLAVFGTTGWAATNNQPDIPNNGEALYSQLSTVGLDKSRVYRIRDASLDRAAIHISLDNGMIGFTQDVYGRVTGAFFEGEGEVLLAPPDKVERTSMALFTGSAILEEQFITAYFRFNDDTYAELQRYLRSAENGQEFLAEWDETARRLAELDALRLFMTFSHFLPVSGGADSATPAASRNHAEDRLLHARMQGRQLGTFDLFFDSTVQEQVWAGQSKIQEGVTYYDDWTSFAPVRRGSEARNSARRRDDVVISHYKIRAEVRPPRNLNGDARFQMEVQSGGQRALLFELSRFLQVKNVEVDGRSVEFIHNQALEGTQLARRGNDLVAVLFPAPLRSGQTVELHFLYGGEVLSEAAKGLLYVGARGTWYPNRGLAMSNFDLEFHYPTEWTLVATGKRMPVDAVSGAVPQTPGEQVTRWVSERPIPVAGFNLGRYVRAVARADDVTVESYATAGVERSFPRGTVEALVLPPFRPLPPVKGPPPMATTVAPPPSPARNAQPVADQAARAVEFFARRFGAFPYSSLELTQMPGDLSQGWPGLVFLSSYAFLTQEEKKQLHVSRLESIRSGQVLVHETAHQWWGDLITWAGYRDQWMFEGLADYCSLMKLQTEKPEEFRDLMEKYRQNLLQKNKEGQVLKDAGPVTLGVRLSSSHFPNGYEVISYGRGTWLFHMLREMLRDAETKSGKRDRRGGPEDEPFVRGLRKVRERYEGRAMSTRDLFQVFAEDLPASLQYEGRKSLDWFVDGWVNGTAMPQFETKGVSYVQKGDAVIISGTLLQKDARDDLVTSVPIYAVTGGKPSVLLGSLFADGPETTFRLKAPMGTRKIVLDPYQTLLTSPR